MNKTYYYTVDERHNMIQVYLIDKNFPILICRFSVENIIDLEYQIKTFLIKNRLYHEGSEIKKL